MINRLMIQSLDRLPIHVFNLAAEDLWLWQELSRAQVVTSIISTNLVPRRSNVPSPAPFFIVDVPGPEVGLNKNVRIGFLGLAAPNRIKPNSEFLALDPLNAVAERKSQWAGRADFWVVLTDLPRETARQLALAHPEIYAILLAEKRFILHPPEQVNHAAILSSVERGRYLGRLTFELDEAGNVVGLESELIELKKGVPEDSTLLK